MVLVPRAPPLLPCTASLRSVFLIAPAFSREGLSLLIPCTPRISQVGLQNQPMRVVRQFLQKSDLELSTELAILLVYIQPRELKSSLHIISSTRVFTAALLTIGKRQKCPKPPQ